MEQEPKPRQPNPPPPKKEPVAPTAPDVPYWIPNDDGWNKLPQQVREAVPIILAPAYRRFVLEAPGELERSIGLTLVHLTWLELRNQIELAVASDPNSFEAMLKNPEDMLDRHLRLATAKCQAAELLLKVQLVQNALQRSGTSPALPPLPRPAPVLPPIERQVEGIPTRRYPFPLPSDESNDAGSFPYPIPLPADSAIDAETGNLNTR
jgi:hypothetical protein